jgi:hypothetical protein
MAGSLWFRLPLLEQSELFAQEKGFGNGSRRCPTCPSWGALHWSSPRYIFQEGMVVGVDREE